MSGWLENRCARQWAELVTAMSVTDAPSLVNTPLWPPSSVAWNATMPLSLIEGT